MKVLVINPGATSTKVAVFEEERELLKKSIIHTAQELEGFDRVIDQAEQVVVGCSGFLLWYDGIRTTFEGNLYKPFHAAV